MSSYFPYNEDEWKKIVEQAFAADAAEPQFSKAYQRRKHRMERKMMRTRCSAKKKVGTFLADKRYSYSKCRWYYDRECYCCKW